MIFFVGTGLINIVQEYSFCNKNRLTWSSYLLTSDEVVARNTSVSLTNFRCTKLQGDVREKINLSMHVMIQYLWNLIILIIAKLLYRVMRSISIKDYYYYYYYY